MGLRTRLGLALVTGALVASLVPAGSGGAAEPPRHAGDPYDVYLYRVSFQAEVVHTLQTERGGESSNYSVKSKISGTLPNAEVATTSKHSLTFKGKKSSVRVGESSVEATDASRDADLYQKCTGNSGRAIGRPTEYPDVEGTSVQLYTGLMFDTTCVDDRGSKPVPGHFSLIALPAALGGASAGDVGDKSYLVTLAGDIKNPVGSMGPRDSSCPGFVEGGTISCEYTITGTVKLTRIKKVRSVPRTPGASEGGTRVTPKKADVKVSCPAKCTVKIELTPLRGGPTLVVDRIDVGAGRSRTVTMPIPPKKRAVVKKSGGVQVKLRYTLPQGITYTETRTARL